MHLKDYLRVLRTRWLLIAFSTLLAALAAVGITTITPPSYQASAQLFVLVQGNDSVIDLNQGNAFAQSRVSSYVALATSARVLRDASREVGVDPGVLKGSIGVENPADTVLINIRATAPTASQSENWANSVADTLVSVVNGLENTDTASPSAAPVTLKKVQDATRPTVPFDPSLTRNVGIGIMLGLILGILAALLTEVLDTRLRGREAIERVSGAGVLGSFEAEPKESAALVLETLHSYSSRTESFRQLRTHLQFVSIDRGIRSVLVTSSIPGEGKSTIASNLAIVLAESGMRTVLIDADLRRPRIAELFGLEGGVGLTTVLTGAAELDTALQPVSDVPALRVLAAGALPPNPAEMLASATMEKLIHRLQGDADIVIIDSPPLVSVSDPSALAALTSGVLVVAAADGRLRRDQLRQSFETLNFVGATIFGMVVNRVRPTGKAKYYGYEPSGRDRARKRRERKKG
ncbi:chromosome partitioning protein [Leifsonia sp. LS1]|uniref:polysaccharide biosynthesis tyrosine autokinase n=1 Tax=Leifsonia sp. LS1 TaxID=2828483 RepID=UPI001CFE6097|nr:polysaccharide biosynthesis tyrosine autokinase [Leifsonia sp. LS1]GIT80785.1 chromosome partitioning protein [Leifsonia sp. LS1]